ncbi:MAG: stage II sporulation protein P [Oscillospiraceae bacterium]|nr:stage II sporulation protein P [Oscillospiraceae bacterium]
MPLSKKERRRTAFCAAAAVMLSPVVFMSVGTVMPSAQELVFAAAVASAELAAGGSKVPAAATYDITAAVQDRQPVFKAEVMTDDSFMLSRGELIMPSSENEELIVVQEPTAEETPAETDSRDGVIAAMSYGIMKGNNFIDLKNGGQVRNVTSVSNEELKEESEKPLDFKIEKNGEPQILIMHTHETESYEPYERDFYDEDFTCRSTDDRMNMAAVGEAITEELEKAGIGVIHDVTKHDHPSYNGSYDRSRVTVQEILEEYPSVKVVLDIHRDAIEKEDGTRIAPVAEIDGKNAAQVMIISGCDDGTMDMPDYMSNFRFATALQQQLESDHPGLTRPVLFDYRKYNQDLTTGSVLIEVGGHANSIDQAVYSGELIGKSLVNLFT